MTTYDNLTLSGRINMYVFQSHDTIADISNRTGILPNLFHDRGEKPINFSWTTLCKLCAACPALSAEFILRGEEPVLKQAPSAPELDTISTKFTDRVNVYATMTKTKKTDIYTLSGLAKHNFTDRPGAPVNMTWNNLIKLCAAFPNLSAEYLLRGELPVIRNLDTKEEENTNTEVTYNIEDTTDFPELLEEYTHMRRNNIDTSNVSDLLIDAMQETIRVQRELIDNLQSQLKKQH